MGRQTVRNYATGETYTIEKTFKSREDAYNYAAKLRREGLLIKRKSDKKAWRQPVKAVLELYSSHSEVGGRYGGVYVRKKTVK